MATLKDIAQRVNRSVTTVSRALAGYSDVSPDTIDLVRETAEAMGYVPNTLAQRLQKRTTDTIGIVLPVSSQGYGEPFFSELLAGIGSSAALLGYDLLVAYAHDNDELATYRKLITGRRVDGFVLFRTLRHDPRAALLTSLGIPFSAFGRTEPPCSFPYVDEDGAYAMELITDHLTQRGHRRIACLCPPQTVMFSYVRLESVRSHLARLGIDLPLELVRIGCFTQKDGYDETCRLLDLPEPPTAIIGFNDLIAFGAVNAAKDHGISVGSELAVTGFDDIPMAEHFRPPLTTIRQPISQIGGMVARLLIEQISAADQGGSQVLLKPELIVREST